MEWPAAPADPAGTPASAGIELAAGRLSAPHQRTGHLGLRCSGKQLPPERGPPMSRRMSALLAMASLPVHADEMGYEAYIDSPKRIKCLYGYVTAKTGNFDAARAIFEDCVVRWNDV